MKNKAVRMMLALSMTAMLSAGVPCSVLTTESEGMEADAGEEKVPEDVTLSLLTGEVVLTNETDRCFSNAEYKKAESKAVENGQVTGDGSEQLAQTWDLVLTEEDGVVHTFQDVRADKWTEPRIIEQFGILYVEFLDEESQKQSALEDGEEKVLDAPVTVYTVTAVNVRQTPDITSQSLKVTQTGEQWSATAALPGWVKVEGNGITGYVHYEYLTEEKEEAVGNIGQATVGNQSQPGVQQNQPVYQEPQTNYQEPEYTPPSVPETQEPSEPDNETPSAPEVQEPSEPEIQDPQQPDDSGDATEVSREDFPNESGDGHGMYEITYSDGSVIYQNY